MRRRMLGGVAGTIRAIGLAAVALPAALDAQREPGRGTLEITAQVVAMTPPPRVQSLVLPEARTSALVIAFAPGTSGAFAVWLEADESTPTESPGATPVRVRSDGDARWRLRPGGDPLRLPLLAAAGQEGGVDLHYEFEATGSPSERHSPDGDATAERDAITRTLRVTIARIDY